MVSEDQNRTRHSSRYEGKNLLRLLLAMGVPAVILYLRIVFAIAGARTATGSQARLWLEGGSYAVLAVFLVVQALCARYVQRLLRPASNRLRDALQYAGVFAMCVFFSVSGAIACEAFGYAVFLRAAPRVQ